MSMYRSILAVLAAAAIASPVFADDTTTSTTTTNDTTGQSATSSMSSGDASATQTKINVNTASLKELTTVKGLTKSNAKAIIAYRKAHGNFQTINDLTSNVKGLGKLKSTTLDQLTVE